MLEYIKYLLNKKSLGSISSNLIAKGLVKRPIDASVETHFDFSMIRIDVKATDTGLYNIDNLTNAIFYQIKLLINEPNNHKTYFEDFKKQKAKETKLRYEEDKGLVFTVELSGAMQNPYIDKKTLLSLGNLPMEFNQTILNKFLSYINPENFNMLIMSDKNLRAKNITYGKWFKTPYYVEDIDPKLIERLKLVNPAKKKARLTKVNAPSSSPLNVITNDTTEACLFNSTTNYEITYTNSTDDENVCSTDVSVQNHEFTESLKTSSLNKIMVEILKTRIIKKYNKVKYVGYEFDIQFQEQLNVYSLIKITLKGPCSGILDFFLEIVEYATKFLGESNDFVEAKNDLIKLNEMKLQQPPYTLSNHKVEYMLSCNEKDYEDTIDTAKNLTLYDYQSHRVSWKKDNFIQIKFHGNMFLEDLNYTSSKIIQFFEFSTNDTIYHPPTVKSRIFNSNNITSVYHKEILNDTISQDSSITYAIQVLNDGTQNAQVLEIFANYLSFYMNYDFIHALRFKESLGYVVELRHKLLMNTDTLFFTLQSLRCPDYLEHRITTFLKDFYDTKIRDMSDDDFDSAIKKYALQNFEFVLEDTTKYTTDTQIGGNSSIPVSENSLISELKKKNFEEFYINNILNPNFKLSSHVLSKNCSKMRSEYDSGQSIQNIRYFRESICQS